MAVGIERFSNDCRKTKTKAITATNHNRNKQRDEPITIPSKKPSASFGPITKRSNRCRVITFYSHLKTALYSMSASHIQIICATYTAFYHTKLNIFLTFLDDAAEWRKIEIKTKLSVAQGLD